MSKSLFSRWRASFVTGLFVLLPAVGTLAIVKWLSVTVAGLTDMLLFFLPRSWTRAQEGQGEMYWYYSLAAFALAVLLVSLVGLLTRYYVGKRLIAWLDITMLRVPLLNKIYSTIKQVNEAFSTGKNTAFKTVVLVQFPREGMYSVGFITSEQNAEVQQKTKERVVCVFVPTTPNPTSGYLVLVPENNVTRLNMSVADAIRYIISLGSVSPDFGNATALPVTAVIPPPPPAEQRGQPGEV